MIPAIADCYRCDRLRTYCEKIAVMKRRSWVNESYWGKPISGFGDPHARLIVVGLAPAAHGANRTGRVFTGDRSGDWLYRALHRFEFANQAHSTHARDGLCLEDAYVTCVVKCAPPKNQPSPEETRQCSDHLTREIQSLSEAQIWIALGQFALKGLWPHLPTLPQQKRPGFKHGNCLELSSGRHLILSYHPSQQNTFTGVLTEPMFDSIFALARRLLK